MHVVAGTPKPRSGKKLPMPSYYWLCFPDAIFSLDKHSSRVPGVGVYRLVSEMMIVRSCPTLTRHVYEEVSEFVIALFVLDGIIEPPVVMNAGQTHHYKVRVHFAFGEGRSAP